MLFWKHNFKIMIIHFIFKLFTLIIFEITLHILGNTKTSKIILIVYTNKSWTIG